MSPPMRLNRRLPRTTPIAAEIEAQLTGQDVPFDVVRSEDEPVAALAAAARLADVVIVSRASGLAGELAMTSRTPVLVLPDKERHSAPARQVACIAWDGGNEAALALRSAVPLLAGCGEVHVLTVKEKPGGFPPTDAPAISRATASRPSSSNWRSRARRGNAGRCRRDALGATAAGDGRLWQKPDARISVWRRHPVFSRGKRQAGPAARPLTAIRLALQHQGLPALMRGGL